MSILKTADLITVDSPAATYDRHKVDGTRQWIRHDVEVYRVTYMTRDTDGREVRVSGGNVLAEAPKNPRVGLDAEFRRDFLDNPRNEMRRALRDNDRYDWGPLAPVFLHHGTHDDIVPFFCAQMAYEAMRGRGGRVRMYT